MTGLAARGAFLAPSAWPRPTADRHSLTLSSHRLLGTVVPYRPRVFVCLGDAWLWAGYPRGVGAGMVSDAAREPDGFTSADAARVLADACRSAGLDADRARLNRFGENALFRLAAHP
jgi:hypothetical protein